MEVAMGIAFIFLLISLGVSFLILAVGLVGVLGGR